MEKGKKEELTVDEKHQLSKLQKELKALDASYKVEVPDYLLIPENIAETEKLKTSFEVEKSAWLKRRWP